jgi:hypothetical protein
LDLNERFPAALKWTKDTAAGTDRKWFGCVVFIVAEGFRAALAFCMAKLQRGDGGYG